MPGKDGVECTAPGCKMGIYRRRMCEDHYTGKKPIRLCSRVECDRPYYGFDYCQSHYQRARRGDVMDAPLPPYLKVECSEEGCYRDVRGSAIGICRMHQQSALRDRGWYRDYGLKRKFKITLEELRQILDAQGHSCMICGDPIGESCHVDHDHDCCPGPTTCGSCIRGLLCGCCNKGLGLFKHDPMRLRNAAKYLEGGLYLSPPTGTLAIVA